MINDAMVCVCLVSSVPVQLPPAIKRKEERKKEKEKVSKGEEIEKREKRKQETNRMMSR